MTAFYQRLLAASSLPSGTVWDLITHPRTVGTGLVVNDGISLELSTMTFDVEIDEQGLDVQVSDEVPVIELNDNTIIIEAEEW